MNISRSVSLLAGMSLIFLGSLATPVSAADDQFKHAEKLYDTYCAQCHGADRDGNGLNSTFISVQPRDHSDPKGMGDIPNDEIIEVIKKGGLAANKSVLMPAWGEIFSDEEVDQLAAYLRHICKCGSN
ncbi:cytochrome c oxidase cbb3-type subunit 3 [Nitrosomonas eutropha]|uniref:Cytochrome c oxidase cbb3-type subunit 3 n=1 Tax=Nitrosomonas eutropha TaxID=916 RepID=A0A1I7G0P1_9PROT|nr:cytochrome c [Nitrosomonas eutropha]SFU42015.1 cytochrome c oxidase cbb3-type subunit 3 [Nitrosomonas eutropha]